MTENQDKQKGETVCENMASQTYKWHVFIYNDSKLRFDWVTSSPGSYSGSPRIYSSLDLNKNQVMRCIN